MVRKRNRDAEAVEDTPMGGVDKGEESGSDDV
jgi:hypothetical protein